MNLPVHHPNIATLDANPTWATISYATDTTSKVLRPSKGYLNHINKLLILKIIVQPREKD